MTIAQQDDLLDNVDSHFRTVKEAIHNHANQSKITDLINDLQDAIFNADLPNASDLSDSLLSLKNNLDKDNSQFLLDIQDDISSGEDELENQH